MSTPSAPNSPLPVYAERVGWGLYGALLGAAVLAHLDRTGAPFLPLWLTFSTLLSLLVLVMLIILFAVLADRSYSDSVRSSGSGILVLGGGLLLTVLLLLPLLQVAESLKHAALPAAHIPPLPFLLVGLGLLALNARTLWAPSFHASRPPARLALALLPYVFILSLWLVWLGRAFWLYLRVGEDALWLKLLCAAFTGAYAVTLGYAGARAAELFRLTRPR